MKANEFLIWLAVCTLIYISGGCAEGLRSSNRQNLMKLSIGMSKEEVLKIMGTRTHLTDAGTINNPYRNETLQGKDKVFEVLYYYTDRKRADGAITDDELTPLVFDNDKLIGWGQSFLDANIKKYEIRFR